MSLFKLVSPYQPAGSQPGAIAQLSDQRPGRSTLMGVTGSGKTFTLANVIAGQDRPVLILSPNKTLAAQLYEEFYQFFPHNKVCYFVSYYDFYQPESYLPAQDIYIPKETKVNREIERLRVEATASLMNRRDVIMIASVSCIYSLGDPTAYRELALPINIGDKISRNDLLHKLIFIQYERNDVQRASGTFQVVGNTVEIQAPYAAHKLRIEFFGNTIEHMAWVDRQHNTVIESVDHTIVFPAKHFVTTQDKKNSAIMSIKRELNEWLPKMANPLYQDRIGRRVAHDLELLEQYGYCNGIENYSSHFDGRAGGQAPFCLFDFFPEDFLCIIDESHIAVPQLGGMYSGDRSRKQSLIDFGFRLPSALDNRPLKFDEIEKYLRDVIFVSATPGQYELAQSQGVVEQVIRPTGLVDPVVEVRSRVNQVNDLIEHIRQTAKRGFRCLVTVLTKQMAEELADHLENNQIKVCYLHSEIKTPERTDILQKLRLGVFDCLVGVNLLREGLDLPEVALVAIMDADIEGFLRDRRSLIQTIGRAARNSEAKVLLYADKITESMRVAMDETARRRNLQLAYNKDHGIQPRTVTREVVKSITGSPLAAAKAYKKHGSRSTRLDKNARIKRMVELEQNMRQAAENLDFELAIKLRNELQILKSTD